jgi:hypothetical protein
VQRWTGKDMKGSGRRLVEVLLNPSTVLPGYNAVVYTADSDIPRVFPVSRFF